MAIIEEIVEQDVTKVEELKLSGNACFGRGEYAKAVEEYEEALAKCPEGATSVRSILLSNLAAAHIKLKQWQPAIDAASKAIDIGTVNEKALERRAFAYSNISEKYETAIEDYKELQKQAPGRTDIASKISGLNKKIAERNEALKADVLGKLKGLGDLCLKPFGLSTDSFELKPNSEGGYSIQMRNGSSSTQPPEPQTVPKEELSE